MTELSAQPDLKEINALKKKLNWGEVSAIYHMASTSIGDLDGILTHGFDSAYKQILNKNTWNLELLGGHKSLDGTVSVTTKPQIFLRHNFDEMGYELHCYPCVNGQPLYETLLKHPKCPFVEWYPETHQMLFRITNFSSFLIYTCTSGDQADKALVRYAYFRVEALIKTLAQSFDIVDTDGLTIAEFYHALEKRQIKSQTSGLD